MKISPDGILLWFGMWTPNAALRMKSSCYVVILVLQTYTSFSCPDHGDWVGGADWAFCYRDMTEVADFVTAANHCYNINATLAMPKNSQEMDQLLNFMATTGKKSAWIYLAKGLYMPAATGPAETSTLEGGTLGVTLTSDQPTASIDPSAAEFMWQDGSHVMETFWDLTEPNSDGDCVEIIAAFRVWNDISCFPTKRNTICQAPNRVSLTTLYINEDSTSDSTQPDTFTEDSTPDSTQPVSFIEDSTLDSTQPDTFTEDSTSDSTQTDSFTEESTPDSTQPDIFTEESTPDSSQPGIFTEESTPDSTQQGIFTEESTPESTQPDIFTEESTPNSTQPDTFTEDSTSDSTQPDTSIQNTWSSYVSLSGAPWINVSETNNSCYTYTVCNSNQTYTTLEIAAKIARIQGELALVRSGLSAVRRSKVSADDPRLSSTSMGIVGGIVIVTIYVSISLLDFVKLKPKKRPKLHIYC